MIRRTAIVLGLLATFVLGARSLVAWEPDDGPPPPPPPPPPAATAGADAASPPPPPPPGNVVRTAPAGETSATDAAATGDSGAPVSPTPLPDTGVLVLPSESSWHGAQVVRGSDFFRAHGSLSVRYRFRSGEGERDQDLYQYLQVRLGDETGAGWSGAFHGRLSEDIDGHNDTRGFYVFDSIADTYRSSVNGKVYHAYLNYRPLRGPMEELRLGRQYAELGDTFHVDGARITFSPPHNPSRIQFRVIGGLPAHLFESSPSGDLIVGGSVTGNPWRGGFAEFDYVHLEDDTRYYGGLTNDLFTLALRQQFSPNFQARASYQHLDDRPRYVTAAFDANVPSRDVFVRGSFRSLVEAQKQLVYDLDPFYAVALDLEQFWEGTLSVSKSLGGVFEVEAGAATRQLFHASDEGRYNHDFGRYFLTLSSFDWPAPNLSLSLSGEAWQSDDDVYSVAFDAEYRPCRAWRLEAGTDFALYRFDLYANAERQNAQGYYVRGRWRPNDRWSFDLRVRVEDDDFGTYTTVNAGIELDF